MKLLNIIAFLLITLSISAQKPDAVYHKMHKTYTLNADGTYVYEYSHQLAYNSYMAFHNLYGETFVVYDPEIQDVEVLQCKTTMADGKVVHAPENAFNEVLPAFAKSAGTYNHLRELVITHTGLEIGAVVDLTYKITHKKNPKGFFAGCEHLSYSSPVNELVITFNVPANITVSFTGNVGERIINDNDEVKSYVFIYKNLKQAPKGKYLDVDDVFSLCFNSGISLNQQVNGIMSDKASIHDGAYQLANTENMEEILSIHKEMVNHMTTIPIPFEFQQFPVVNEHELELRGYGTPIEKALVLRQKLLAKNIIASMAFALPSNEYDPATASLQMVSDIYVMVPHANGEPILLPLTHIPSVNEIYANYQNITLALDENYDFIKLLPKTTNYADVKMDITMENDKAAASYESNIAGIFTQWINSKVTSGDLFNSVEQEQTPTKLGHDPFAYALNGTLTLESSRMGDYLEIFLPQFQKGINRFSVSSFPTEKMFAIRTNYPMVEQYKYTVHIPDGYKIVRKPMNYELNNDFMAFEIKTAQTGNKLDITMVFNIESVKIPSEFYNTFRKALVTFSNELNRTVVIKKE